MTTRRRLAAAAILPLLAACSTSSPPGPGASATPPPVSTPSSATTPSASPLTSAGAALAVYFLRDSGRGPRLHREFHRVSVTDGPVHDAVMAMLTRGPVDADYTSLWPAGTVVLGTRTEGTTAYVDLSDRALTGAAGAAAESATLQQLVHTVTAADNGVAGVQLLVEGKQVPTLWGHVDTTKPIRRGPAAEVLAPVWITTPDSGTLARGGTFGGQATVFEATVSWELLQGGKVVERGFSTATTGAPGRGDWTAKADVPPGDYVLRAFESSAKDGSPQWVDDKPLRVTG